MGDVLASPDSVLRRLQGTAVNGVDGIAAAAVEWYLTPGEQRELIALRLSAAERLTPELCASAFWTAGADSVALGNAVMRQMKEADVRRLHQLMGRALARWTQGDRMPAGPRLSGRWEDAFLRRHATNAELASIDLALGTGPASDADLCDATLAFMRATLRAPRDAPATLAMQRLLIAAEPSSARALEHGESASLRP